MHASGWTHEKGFPDYLKRAEDGEGFFSFRYTDTSAVENIAFLVMPRVGTKSDLDPLRALEGALLKSGGSTKAKLKIIAWLHLLFQNIRN